MIPTPSKYAAALGKVCRYAGRGLFFPVLLHLFVCADLVEPQYKLWAMTHDLAEQQTGDLNSLWKSPELRHAEDRLLNEIYDGLGIPQMSNRGHQVVKTADLRSRQGEVWTVGDPLLRKTYPVRDREAEKLTLFYYRKFPPKDCINPKGKAVQEFVRRFRKYRVFVS